VTQKGNPTLPEVQRRINNAKAAEMWNTLPVACSARGLQPGRATWFGIRGWRVKSSLPDQIIFNQTHARIPKLFAVGKMRQCLTS
jgi:hypothetical protein